MRFPAHYLAILASASSLVSATCYGQGQDGKMGADLASMSPPGWETACDQLVGFFLGGDKNATCIEDKAGTKWNFELQYLGSPGGTREIKRDECMDGMIKEIKGCRYGGHSSYTNWAYKADPNLGACF